MNQQISSEQVGPSWHLFIVKDCEHTLLLSGHSASQAKAEELVIAAAIDEHDFDPDFAKAEFVAIVDRDVCEAIEP